ncbi:MAG: hypothetical protein EXR96_09940 [Nitrospiraceae bacterium]|nr:hypothetical protein [Nitrospiraceae bacterium]
MKSMQLVGLVALMVILAAGCSTQREGSIKLAQGGGMYSALDATAQVYSNPRAQAPVEDSVWRYAAYALHPAGGVLDYAINRPIYALASAFPYLFGYTSEDEFVSSQFQKWNRFDD